MAYHFYSIRDILKQPELYVAHHSPQKGKETLEQHSNLVYQYYKQLKKDKRLDRVIERLLDGMSNDISDDAKDYIQNLFEQAIYLHDIGKANLGFQEKIQHSLPKTMNPSNKNTDHLNSKHSRASSAIYFHLFIDDILQWPNEKERKVLLYTLSSFAYVISRHHSSLQNGEDALKNFILETNSKTFKQTLLFVEFDYLISKDQDLNLSPMPAVPLIDTIKERTSSEKWVKNLFKTISKIKFSINPSPDREPLVDGMNFYILNKLLFSSLINADFFATFDFYHLKESESPMPFSYFSKTQKNTVSKTFHESEIMKGIESYKKGEHSFDKTPINAIRSDILWEATETIKRKKDHHVFYLEAPTGSGKTFTSMSCALSLLQNTEVNQWFYVFPFNTLADQTEQVLKETLDLDEQKVRLETINSLSPISMDNAAEDMDIERKMSEAVLKRQAIQYPMTITSHVKMYDYIFGTSRESNLGFVHLANSVMVFDEIQSYSSDLWSNISLFFNRFTHAMDAKTIFMSATLPSYHNLLSTFKKRRKDHFHYPFSKDSSIDLLTNATKYTKHDTFKNRVTVNYDFLNDEWSPFQSPEDASAHFVPIINKEAGDGNTKIIIEFIKKDDCESAYKFLRNEYLSDSDKVVVKLTSDDAIPHRKSIIDHIKNHRWDNVILVTTQVVEAGVDIDMDIGFKNYSLYESEEQFMGRINRSCERSGSTAYFFQLTDPALIYRKDLRLNRTIKDKKVQTWLKNKDLHAYYVDIFDRLEKSDHSTSYTINRFQSDSRLLNFIDIEREMQLIQDNQNKIQIFLPYKDPSDPKINGYKARDNYNETLRTLEYDSSFSEKKISFSNLYHELQYFLFSFGDHEIIKAIKEKTDYLSKEEEYRLREIFNEMKSLNYYDFGEPFLYKDSHTNKYTVDKNKLLDLLSDDLISKIEDEKK